jgi:hypothetical protein
MNHAAKIITGARQIAIVLGVNSPFVVDMNQGESTSHAIENMNIFNRITDSISITETSVSHAVTEA